MAVNTINNKYTSWANTWQKAREGVAGQEVIKSKRSKYLPELSGQDKNSYQGYLDRANYINFTNRILQIAIGQIFRKQPIVNFEQDNDYMEFLYRNIDLSSTNFTNFSKEVFREILLVNRVGILVDYNTKSNRPYLTMYKTEAIINWRYQLIEGINKLTMVILQGEVQVEDPLDRFSTKTKKVWKELYLDDLGIYQYRDWSEEKAGVFIYADGETPLKKDQPLDYIPFHFVTQYGLSDNIDRAPLLDIVNVNLSHYKNNADYENMIHWTGAKTIITKMWNSGSNDKPFPIGGCADFNSPEGDAKFLECQSDSALFNELKHKEEIMATLGSSLLAGKGRYVASAETARITSEGEYATLADISYTVSGAISNILKDMMSWEYNYDISNKISVEYNTDYEVSELTPQALTAYISAVQSGLMSKETYFYNLKSKEMYPDKWSFEKEFKEVTIIPTETQSPLDKSIESVVKN